MDYLPRVVDSELAQLLPDLPAVTLEGPKGVGKTATALRLAGTVYRLDDPGQRAIAAADPTRLVTGRPPVLIDEWQRVPESWDLVRRAVDDDPSGGRFLLTGSATPPEAPMHSGAGRIVKVRMRPLTLTERRVARPTVSLRELLTGARPDIAGDTDVALHDYTDEIVRSGFPGLRGLLGRPLRAQLDGYLTHIVEHDLNDAGHRVRRPDTVRRWMTAYAAATATTTSYEKIRDAATGGDGDKPAKTTTIPYRDALERLWIVDPIPPWLPTRNLIKQLASPPKHHLADPALAARLLGVGLDGLLDAHNVWPALPRDGTLLGQLFESLVTLDVRVYAQAAEARVGHLRSRGGRYEVDLIVERDDHRVLAIEVKLARTVTDDDVRQLTWLGERIGDDLLDAIVICTGPHAYRRRDGVGVVPAALLGP